MDQLWQKKIVQEPLASMNFHFKIIRNFSFPLKTLHNLLQDYLSFDCNAERICTTHYLSVDIEITRTETSSETIAGHGDPIDGFLPGQPWASAGPRLAIAGPWHLFNLVVAGSALARDGIEILGTVRLALLGLLLHFFQFTKVAKDNPEPIRITHRLIFFKNFNSLTFSDFFSMLFPANFYPIFIARKFFTFISCNDFLCDFFLKKTCIST